MATRIGIDGLAYALMTAEDTASTAPAYAAVVRAPGVMSLNISPNGSLETLFADDGPIETASTLGKIEVEIKKNALTTADRAALLGHLIDANGGLVHGDSDVPPWVAIGFRTLKSNGTYRYTWLYKGKFTEPDDSNETKGDGINFQADTIKGQFCKLTYAVTPVTGGRSVRPWKYDLDEEHTTANEFTVAKWFTAPVLPKATADAV